MQPLRRRHVVATPMRPLMVGVPGGLAAPRPSCVTIMEIDEEEARLWDEIAAARSGR